MADAIVPHKSGIGDAVDHWLRVVHEQRAENAALTERLYFDSRIAEAAEAYVATADDPGINPHWPALCLAVKAKRDHLTAEQERKTLNGRGKVTP